MRCDLERIFGEMVAQLSASLGGDKRIVLTSQNLPVPPTSLVSDELYILKGTNTYPLSYRVDLLNFFAHKETYSHLGLLFLAVVLHPHPSRVLIELTHPASDIKNLVVAYEHRDLDDLPGGYHTRPFGFVYFSDQTSKHPFPSYIASRDLPCFGLTNMKDVIATEEDWRNRDTVKSFGNDVGAALFAELLLNAGQPANVVDEYELEGAGGFRGVGIHSAEVRLFLPGHLYWDDTKW